MTVSRAGKLSFDHQNPNQMEPENEDERLIGRLIRKRKTENEAFLKLLHAIETERSHPRKKSKPKKPKP